MNCVPRKTWASRVKVRTRLRAPIKAPMYMPRRLEEKMAEALREAKRRVVVTRAELTTEGYTSRR